MKQWRKLFMAVVLLLALAASTTHALAPGVSGGTSNKVHLGAEIPFGMMFYGGFGGGAGLLFDMDFGVHPAFSIAPRLGIWAFNSFHIGVSFKIGIIAPNLPTGFAIGPSIDIFGIGSGVVGLFPAFEFNYKYSFPFHFYLGGNFRVGLLILPGYGAAFMMVIGFKLGGWL
jgi:hypothetical protein